VAGNRDRARLETETRREQAVQTSQTYLLFRAGPFERLGVPLSLVARLEEFPRSKIERAGNRLVVQYRGRILPLAPLAPILEPGCPDTASAQDPVPAIVFNDGERRLGLLVDQLTDIVDDTVAVRHNSGRRGLLGSAVVGKRVTDILDLDAVIAAASQEWTRQDVSSVDGVTVLLAEGSAFSRSLLRSSLEMAGCRVVEASSSAEALTRLECTRVNVVIADPDLPGGAQFLEKLRREPALSQIPVLALAGSSQQASELATHPGLFQEFLVRGDRDAMLRSIYRLAAALESPPPVPAMAGEERMSQ
jgi:two-component system chemotaxis sensor kinase CheA